MYRRNSYEHNTGYYERREVGLGWLVTNEVQVFASVGNSTNDFGPGFGKDTEDTLNFGARVHLGGRGGIASRQFRYIGFY